MHMVKKPTIHRIALISDGRGVGAPLDYAIDACSRQGAKIDLLLHGAIDAAKISSLENQIRAAGLDYHRIQLGMTPVDAQASPRFISKNSQYTEQFLEDTLFIEHFTVPFYQRA